MKVFVNFKYDEDAKVWDCKRKIGIVHMENVIRYSSLYPRMLCTTESKVLNNYK